MARADDVGEEVVITVEEKLEDALDALQDYKAINKQFFAALEKVNALTNDWDSGEIECDAALGAIAELVAPFFYKPDE